MRLCVPIPCFFKQTDFCTALRTVAQLGFDAAETYQWKGLDQAAVAQTCRETGVELLSMCTSEFRMTDARCLRYTVSGQEKSLSIPPGEYAGNGETQRN